ncbi:shikimate dehydrogenase [Phenylobacterium soli]|uniref:Shikimate dehydrogenase (NADP(+)) n=1 Tax=Phenylobacterium soli TaxID=2170551 RepID=A0A328AEK2_9CAUL|nr:shikimate dehydrogenase [Phenylobacterium soli]RAK51804.1 shikimate dehydrogenase [Phenylobacterium soli]
MSATSQQLIRTGLVGDGIQGSRSPALHEEEAAALGLQLTYVRFDLADPATPQRSLEEVLDYAQGAGFAGVNVTYPYKQQVIALLDELSPQAERLGAVNTVIFKDGRRTGHNTDWFGFRENFRRGLPEAPRERVAQLGAGGAGLAVGYALLEEGVGQLVVFDLDRARAQAFVETLGRLFGPERVAIGSDLAGALGAANGVVNCTPIGMTRHPGSPAPAELLTPRLWVADIVYVPFETELLRSARAAGCRTLDGGGMVVFQAAEAFRLFTGVTPDAERMRARFLDSIRDDLGTSATGDAA